MTAVIGVGVLLVVFIGGAFVLGYRLGGWGAWRAAKELRDREMRDYRERHVCSGPELDEAMRALARHDGRAWCAVCGHRNEECAAKTPDCLGARARRLHPDLVPAPNVERRT